MAPFEPIARLTLSSRALALWCLVSSLSTAINLIVASEDANHFSNLDSHSSSAFLGYATFMQYPRSSEVDSQASSYWHSSSAKYQQKQTATTQSRKERHNQQQFEPEFDASRGQNDYLRKNQDLDAEYFHPDSAGHLNFGEHDHSHQAKGPVSDSSLSDDLAASGNVNDQNQGAAANQHGSRAPDKEYLNHNLAEQACRLYRGCERRDRLNNTYLDFCTRYKLESLFSNSILMSIMHDESEECERILDEFIQLDELISQFYHLFKNLLRRYNCHNGYSVKWSCEDCKRSYEDWLCATNLPYYMKGERIKPCISFCERVEQRCPYLHPITKEQYGGQPVFICRDPNIPFVPAITPDIPYSEPTKCYDLCHLSDNITELRIDSLSKYDYKECPNKTSIAEEVRRDPFYCKIDDQHSQINHTDVLTDQYNTGSSSPADELNGSVSGSNATKLQHPTGRGIPHVHTRKLDELRAVLAVYKSQPKTHKLGHYSEHSTNHHLRSSELQHSVWHAE